MKKRIVRIAAAVVVFAAAFFITKDAGYVRLFIFIASYITAGYDVLYKAARNISHGQVFDENFLMAIATIGAFFVGEYPEGAAVMIFYQIGEIFQDHAVERSRRSISSLMELRPEYVNVKTEDGVKKLDPYDAAVGDIMVIMPWERVPLDGVVTEGTGFLDASALTGESVPREVFPGSELLSGCVNTGSVLTARITKEYADSTVSRILELVEDSLEKKARHEKFITRFSRVYTPAVVAGAAVLAVVPPLFIAGHPFSDWIYRALLFLVVSCPCALVISVPLGFFCGIGGASRIGVLVKGGNHLETLARADTFVFDKTGTLTKGAFEVKKIYEASLSKSEILRLAAFGEYYSNHPAAVSIKAAYRGEVDESLVSDMRELSGMGVFARVAGTCVLLGNFALMEKYGINARRAEESGTIIYVAADGEYAGYILLSDEIKPGAADMIAALKRAGAKLTVMLTGDVRASAERTAAALGIDETYSELLPEDKVSRVEQLKAAGRKGVVYTGDGINDAPVLACADVGIAMGAFGSDAAIEAADIVVMDDDPARIADAVRTARRTMNIVRGNVAFALIVKGAVLLLGALGAVDMWAAVFADVGVAVIAILNSMRALRVKR
ncbi:MAG: cadmium-translocating P-type ATPase [Clostridia bacterium]|nr:cadmium-translocating P-type ATPase [Clostridia bacterium]